MNAQETTKEFGFTLIEVLITVVVLSIGLLGVASLQYMSKRSNMDAAQRTIASMLAFELIERMRMNATALENYVTNSAAPVTLTGSSTPTPARDCSTAATFCRDNELAVYDLWEWERALMGASERSETGENVGGLVSPTACLITDVPVGPTVRSGTYTVAIVWRGATPLSNPTNPTPPPAGTPDPYTCGEGSDLYKNTEGVADLHRRILVISAYIAEP